MDVRSYLKDYAARADRFLDKFFDKKIKEVKQIGGSGRGVRIAVDMLERYRRFSRGGKKLRGALIQLGYEIAGGNKTDVLPASISLEIIHSFLLMHDDIMDMDPIRRGAPTIHKQFEQIHRRLGHKSDSYHFGISMGIDMGDLGAYLANEALLGAKIEDSRKIRAAVYLSRLLQRVAFGQALDVLYEQRQNISESDVMEVHLQKTSIYTIGGPIKIGALLGGMRPKNIDAIEKYGEPVGIAFQLRDDELGLFSDEKTLGKPIGNDIREGKNTILRIKAIQNAAGAEKKFLVGAYGNKSINKKDVKKVQGLTIKTGALGYSRELSKKLVEGGKKYIPQITKRSNFQDMLIKAADYVITRES
ncbi:hypothetical protein A2125_00025 [Candidatus Woesebacteria bacterium GWB1_43_5]|uniref:Polyprenyl synthetase n=1 Tax=Candidatus Woesebacteria bacterium GWB1_43_5 TaxID=1802474 RepID=A0A1F7WTB2_9BACT|nr:MAG: hypothetical protein A2125_00025 [Candidatus Woesebacteria bacterium GWB1_43_5]